MQALRAKAGHNVPTFLIFSDGDVSNWKCFRTSDCVIVASHASRSGLRDVDDLVDMAMCQGGSIISNSTFAWWSATISPVSNRADNISVVPPIWISPAFKEEAGIGYEMAVGIPRPVLSEKRLIKSIDPFPFKASIHTINLFTRDDRLKEIQSELTNMRLPTDGFEAKVIMSFRTDRHPKKGWLGCTNSHIRCLEHAEKLGMPFAVILEDDAMFNWGIHLGTIRAVLQSLMRSGTHWDVLNLGGTAARSHDKQPLKNTLHPALARVNHVQTTACYVVRTKYIPSLLKCWKEAYDMGMSGEPEHIWACHVAWDSLMKEDTFLAFRNTPVRQRASFSDITHTYRTYNDDDEINWVIDKYNT